MLTDTTRSPYAKVHALDGMKVKWTGGLWKGTKKHLPKNSSTNC